MSLLGIARLPGSCWVVLGDCQGVARAQLEWLLVWLPGSF